MTVKPVSLALTPIFVFTAFNYGPQSRPRPLLVAFRTPALIAPVVLNEIHPIRLIREIDISPRGGPNEGVVEKEPEHRVSSKKPLFFLPWIVGFFTVIFVFGFHLGGIAGFTILPLKGEGGVGRLKAALFAVLWWAGIFIMFEKLMGFGLFEGWIFGSITPQI